MSKLRPKFSITEALLCAWVIGAQVWYLLQFRPLFAGLGLASGVAFFIARIMFLFLATMGFELALILCAVCVVRLLLNAVGFGGAGATDGVPARPEHPEPDLGGHGAV